MDEYSEGIFVLNEDWYGHHNSTINYLSEEGDWTYRVFQKANPGHELGATSRFGTIYGDKIYIVSKQAKDNGASITGSRLAICNAKTMKVLKEIQDIATNAEGVSIADGRSFLAVNEKKAYIGTNNGVWIFDIEEMSVGSQIEGTAGPIGSPHQTLISSMIRTEDHVLAVHKEKGVLVIDPETDKIIQTIAAPVYDNNGTSQQSGLGAIVQSKDGYIWASMSVSSGSDAALAKIMKMNPISFEYELIDIPNADGIESIPNSWGASQVDAFFASTQENKTYWKGKSGYLGYRIFSYDIDKNTFAKVYDFQTAPGEWQLYGSSFGIHPVSSEIYCTAFRDYQHQTYKTFRLSSTGELLGEYALIDNYWFPAMTIFPDNHEPLLGEIPEIHCALNGSSELELNKYVSDADNTTISIVKSILKNTAPQIFQAEIKAGKLKITAEQGKEAIGFVKLRFNSNGKTVDAKIKVTVGAGGEVFDDPDDVSIEESLTDYAKIYCAANSIYTENCAGYQISIYDLNGVRLSVFQIHADVQQESLDLPAGKYIVHARKGSKSKTLKVVID